MNEPRHQKNFMYVDNCYCKFIGLREDSENRKKGLLIS